MNLNQILLLLPKNPTLEEIDRERLIETSVGLSLAAIIGCVLFYLYLRYVHYKLKGEFRYKSKFNEYNHVDALVLLSMNVLRSHPQSFQDKCLYIKEYILYLYPNNDSFFESLNWSYRDTYSSKSIVKWLNTHLNEDAIQDGIRFLISMAAVDGVIAPKERKELIGIIDSFQIDSGNWIKMMDEINEAFVQRQKQWKSKGSTSNLSYRESLVQKAMDYFEISKEELSETTLRKKYLVFVKKYHPDRSPNATPEERKELEIKFQEVQLYYDELLKLLAC